MTRKQSYEILKQLWRLINEAEIRGVDFNLSEYDVNELFDEADDFYDIRTALNFAMADMKTLQDVLDAVDGVMTE